MRGRGARGKSFSSNGAHAPSQSAALASAPQSSSLCNSAGLRCAAAAGRWHLLPSDLMTCDKLWLGTKATLNSALGFADSTCCRKKTLLVLHSVLRMQKPGRVPRYRKISKIRSDVLSVGKALACAGVQGREGV